MSALPSVSLPQVQEPSQAPARWVEIALPQPLVRSDEALLETAIRKIRSGNYLFATVQQLERVESQAHREGEPIALDPPPVDPSAYVTKEFLKTTVLVAKDALKFPTQTTYCVLKSNGPKRSPRSLRFATSIANLLSEFEDPHLLKATRIFSIERQGG